MFWNGTRWIVEHAPETPAPRRRRRHRGWLTTAVTIVAVAALAVPFAATSVAARSGARLVASSNGTFGSQRYHRNPGPTPAPTATPATTPAPTATPATTPAPTATPATTPAPTATPATTPAPTATPVTTPAPTATAQSSRPFAAPVTTATYAVPLSIDATGATDVSSALNSYIATVPNGSIIAFPTGAIYRLSAGIGIGARNNLVFEGNGATLRTYGAGTDQTTSPFLLGWAGYWTGISSHITIHNFILQGSASPVGVGGQGEEQAGIKAHSATYVEVYGNTVRGVTGDAFQIENTNSGPFWIHDNTVESAGRNGVTVGGGSNILAERNAFVKIGYCTFDIEPTPGYPTITNGVIFRNNSPSNWSTWAGYGGFFFSADGSHTGYPIDNVAVTGNTVTGASLNSQFNNGGTTRNASVVFTNNVLTSGAVAGPVLVFAHIDGLTVTGNSQPLSSGVLANITDSTGVTYP